MILSSKKYGLKTIAVLRSIRGVGALLLATTLFYASFYKEESLEINTSLISENRFFEQIIHWFPQLTQEHFSAFAIIALLSSGVISAAHSYVADQKQNLNKISILVFFFFFLVPEKSNACIDSVSSAHTITSSCSGGGDPIDVLTGADITINSGVTVSNNRSSSREGDPFHVDSGSAKITNNGTIYTPLQYGITNYATGVIIINNGSISSGTRRAIVNANGATIDTLTNTGTISGPYSDILNEAEATITTLNNLQGAGHSNGDLEIFTNLPINYNIIVNNTSTYGKLSHKGGTSANTLTFGIHSTSSIVLGTYTNVLDKITTSELAATRSGTFGGYNWVIELAEGDSDTWNLVVSNPRTGYTSRINNAKRNKIAEILEAINTAGNKSSVTTALDGLSDANLEKALKEIQGKSLVTSKSLATRNQSNFKRAVSSATNISASTTTQLTKGNFADLSLNDLSYHGLNNDKSFSGYSGSNFSDFLTSNLNKTLTSSGSSENSFFIRTFGSVTDYTAKDTDDTGYQATNYGILAGSQYKITNDIYQGWSLGGSLSDSNYDSSAGGSKAKTVHASIFQKYDYEDHGLDFSLSGYVSNSDTTRKITTGVQQTLLSDATDKGLDFTTGYTKKYKLENNWNFHPSVSLATSYVFQDDTKETGGNLALNVQNDNLFSVKPEIGFSLGKEFDNTEEVTKNFNISLFASREEYLDGTVSSATLNGTNTPYHIELPKIRTDYVTAGVGYNFENKKDNSNANVNLFQTQSSDNDLNSTLLSVSYNKTF